MAKGAQAQNLPADVANLIDQLERHCLAPDGSHVSKSAHSDLQLAREEMSRERTRYLEAMAVYCEAIAMVEEYHQAVAAANLGGARDPHGLYSPLGLNCSPQVYECLEHRLAVAEAAQKLRLPLLSKDGEIREEDIEKMSRSSLDSTGTSITLSSSTNSTSYNTSYASSGGVALSAALNTNNTNNAETVEPGVGGVPNRFLGVTPGFMWRVQEEQPAMDVDMAEYQRCLIREIESRLDSKCVSLAEIFATDDIADSSIHQISSARLPERVKLITEEIEKEEAILLDDLYSMDRKFAEHYNVLEQILGVLIKFVKDLKLQHQHQYDELKKTWLCKRCQTMNAKLRKKMIKNYFTRESVELDQLMMSSKDLTWKVRPMQQRYKQWKCSLFHRRALEHILLRDTYTKDSVPALHMIRKYLVEATEEASIAYNKAVTRLREYQGVDPHFDTIARQYHEIVKKLEGMQWTIHQVEMDLKRSHDHPTS